jgi:hypothetical protein
LAGEPLFCEKAVLLRDPGGEGDLHGRGLAERNQVLGGALRGGSHHGRDSMPTCDRNLAQIVEKAQTLARLLWCHWLLIRRQKARKTGLAVTKGVPAGLTFEPEKLATTLLEAAELLILAGSLQVALPL